MSPAIYFPLLRGRAGELEALQALSPSARVRIAPLIELPTLPKAHAQPLDDHAGTFVCAVVKAWGVASSLYLDLKRHPPDLTNTQGKPLVEHLFNCARQGKLRAIPVTGPLAERGPGRQYIDAIARIAALDRRGAALRIPYEDFSDVLTLKREIEVGAASLALTPKDIDLFLDASESLAGMPATEATGRELVTTLINALGVARPFGFRSIVFVGSSVPHPVPLPKEEDKPLVFTRREWQLWKELAARPELPLLRFGDSGVWSPNQPDTGGGGGGPPPARVRLPLGDEQLFFRADARAYRTLCRRALRHSGAERLSRCWGLDAIRACALGHGAEEIAATWVARDVNIHVETTASAIEEYLGAIGRLKEIELARVQSAPWQQGSMVEAFEPEM